MTTTRPIVELTNVRKSFGNFIALDNINLAIQEGEFFSVLGPSGCGKSTMLRLIAGLEHADAGSLSVGGNSMDRVPAHKRPCNMVFQNYAIFPHLTVSDNVAYGLRNLGLTRADKQARVQENLAAVQLTGLESRKPDQLSGGQRQRVALARALARRPKVLLLDEPLGALDKTLREQMQHELRELQKSVGITFVLVTHDQEEALSMSDRIAVMQAGKVLQVASPIDIYEKPNCMHVASFIGDMNFLPAVTDELQGARQVAVTVRGFGQLTFSRPLDAECAGFAHQVAVRPEKLRLTADRTDGELCVCGTVLSSSYWGDQSQFQVAIEGCDTPLTVAAHNLGGAGGALPVRGERVWLSVPHSALLRFCK